MRNAVQSSVAELISRTIHKRTNAIHYAEYTNRFCYEI